MILRPAAAADTTAMAAVHAASFDAPWNAADLAALMGGFGVFALMVEVEGGCGGFVIVRAVADEAEVLTLAVDPALRRQGAARALMAAASSQARAAGAAALFLEVADDNPAGLGLYSVLGFEAAGRRRGYYHRPDGRSADAHILRCTLNSPIR